MTRSRLLLILVVALLLNACSGRIATGIAQTCSEELDLAQAELDRAKADGFGDAVAIVKASSLLTAAAFKKQVEHYEGCVDQARRARAYIADVRKH